MGSRDLKIMDGINCGVQEATDFLKKKNTTAAFFLLQCTTIHFILN